MMVMANPNWTTTFIVKGCPKWNGYKTEPAITPVTKNKNRLDHMEPLNPSTPYSEAFIHIQVQHIANKYG